MEPSTGFYLQTGIYTCLRRQADKAFKIILSQSGFPLYLFDRELTKHHSGLQRGTALGNIHRPPEGSQAGQEKTNLAPTSCHT